jgi:phosphatidylserine decarboxylase
VNFAREGLAYIAAAFAIAAAALVFALLARSWPLWIAAMLFTVVALWVAAFFRDPERGGVRGENLVIAPADGRVVLITTVDEPSFLRGRAQRISIFMNIFNVHVNRYPFGGTVSYLKYVRGKFLDAHAEQASLENEQSSVGIEGGGHRVLVRQIAGLIARRIITYPTLNDSVQQGDRMGLIRFGSRVDVFVPENATLKVKVGDLPVAGTTVLAELR